MKNQFIYFTMLVMFLSCESRLDNTDLNSEYLIENKSGSLKPCDYLEIRCNRRTLQNFSHPFNRFITYYSPLYIISNQSLSDCDFENSFSEFNCVIKDLVERSFMLYSSYGKTAFFLDLDFDYTVINTFSSGIVLDEFNGLLYDTEYQNELLISEANKNSIIEKVIKEIADSHSELFIHNLLSTPGSFSLNNEGFLVKFNYISVSPLLCGGCADLYIEYEYDLVYMVESQNP